MVSDYISKSVISTYILNRPIQYNHKSKFSDKWKGEKMNSLSTNLALKDSLDSHKNENGTELEGLPKEILDKIKLIEKAFR